MAMAVIRLSLVWCVALSNFWAVWTAVTTGLVMPAVTPDSLWLFVCWLSNVSRASLIVTFWPVIEISPWGETTSLPIWKKLLPACNAIFPVWLVTVLPIAEVDKTFFSSRLSLWVSTLFLLLMKVLFCDCVCATEVIRKSPFVLIWRFLSATISEPSIAISLPEINFNSPCETRWEPFTDSVCVSKREEFVPCQELSEFVLKISVVSLTAVTLIEPPADILAWLLLLLPRARWLPSICISLPLVMLVFLPTVIVLPCWTFASTLPIPPKRSSDFWSWVSIAPMVTFSSAVAWKFPPMSTLAPAKVKSPAAVIRASWATLMLALGPNCVCWLEALLLCGDLVWVVVTNEILPPACISNSRACSFALLKSISFFAASNIFLPDCRAPKAVSKPPSACNSKSCVASRVPEFLKFWIPVNWMELPETNAPFDRLFAWFVCAKYNWGTNAWEVVPSGSVTSCCTSQTMSDVSWDICSAVSAIPNVSCVDLANVTPLAIKSAYCFWLSE